MQTEFFLFDGLKNHLSNNIGEVTRLDLSHVGIT